MNLFKIMNPNYKKLKYDRSSKEDKLKQHAAVYDSAQWSRLRTTILNEQPLCYMCKLRGKLVSSDTVDHCVTFDNKHDVQAYDSNNLFALCHSCHASLTMYEMRMKYKWREMYLNDSSVDGIQKIADEKYKVRIEVGLDGYRKEE